MKLSIVIPNFNGADHLLACLESLGEAINYTKHKGKFEVILVDNNSADNSCLVTYNFCDQTNIPHKILKLDNNYGFAGAVNRGIAASRADWVLLCNNDIKVDKKWLQIITEILEKNQDPKTAAVTGTILNGDGTAIESQGLRFYYSGKCDNINNGKILTKGQKKNIVSKEPIYIWGASAALTAYRVDIIENLGGFDENFFAYEEDVDLSLRLHKMGYITLYVPSAFSYHLGGATSSRMGNFHYRMDAKNWIYIVIKNFTGKEILTNLLPIIEQRLRNFSGLIKNTPKRNLVTAITKTYGEVIRNIPTMIAKRNLIMKQTSHTNCT